jgi:hypothetical protein
MATRLFSRYLDTVGDGSGTYNAIGDYGGGQVFKLAPGADEVMSVARMIVSIRDSGAMSAEKYGFLNELSTGVTVGVYDNDGLLFLLTDADEPITSNAMWGGYCYDVDLKTFGSGDEFLLVRWTFARFGAPIVLQGAYGQYLGVTLNDDMTGLVEQTFLGQGIYLDNKPY